jgi:hypothetical protein
VQVQFMASENLRRTFFFQYQTSTHAILREKRDYKSEGQSN